MSLGNIGKPMIGSNLLSKGWSSLREQAHNALTYFKHDDEQEEAANDNESSDGPERWGLLATDLIDRKGEIEIRLEVPGVAKEDLSVQIRDGLLAVSGTKRMSSSRRDGGLVIQERAFGSFTRHIPLSADVDIQRAEATYADGVLTLTVPKTKGSSARNVAID